MNIHIDPVMAIKIVNPSMLLTECIILQVAEYESTTFAIFYNNALFLSVLIFASFYVFPATVSPTINYVASMGISAGLIALLSTGTASA